MKKNLYFLGALALLMTSCNSPNTDKTNTGRNVRDRDEQAVTSGNQSESSGDLAITQGIRRALLDDPNLSTNAKNIKVITIDGVVTLRGPVNGQAEKERVFLLVRQTQGLKDINDQLETK